MASPQVDSYSTGVENTAISLHSINMPSGIIAGDLLLLIMTMPEVSTGTYLGYEKHTGMDIMGMQSSVNWRPWSGSLITYDTCEITGLNTAIFYAIALGSSNDYLDLWPRSYYTYVVNNRRYKIWMEPLPENDIQCTSSYICYRISGHSSTFGDANVELGNPFFPYRLTGGSTGSTWMTNACPESDDGLIRDYLYIFSTGSNRDHIATAAATNYTNLITIQGSDVDGCVSTSSCRRAVTTISQQPTTYMTGAISANVYISSLIRIPPLGSTDDESIGFGFYVYSDTIHLP